MKTPSYIIPQLTFFLDIKIYVFQRRKITIIFNANSYEADFFLCVKGIMKLTMTISTYIFMCVHTHVRTYIYSENAF